MTHTPDPATIERDALERAAKVADAEAQKLREDAAKCPNWSPAQAERMRAKDTAMNIADAIRSLSSIQGEG